MDDAPQIVSYLAPAGRHVYRTRHTPNTQSPRGATCHTGIREEYLTQGRKDATHAEKSGIESVGVGLPNPCLTSLLPLTWRLPAEQLLCRLGNPHPRGRFTFAVSPRGAACL